jgi:hypothetical protein
MAGPLYYDRVKETTTTTGTGTYTLAGAVTGFQSFGIVGDTNTCYYAITDGTAWEVGMGTYTLSGTTLARTTILASSNANAAVSWSAGSKTIWLDLPATAAALTGAAMGTALSTTTAKATPVDTDGFLLTDSAASGAGKLLTGANLKKYALNGLVIRRQVFTSSGTYTPNANMVYCDIECLGGGGGSGGIANTAPNTITGAGGGAGSYSKLRASMATIGVSQTVTIGAAGAAGAAGANSGGAGGDTSVGSLCIAKGASGGAGANYNGGGQGGAGGATVGGVGDIVSQGASGGGAIQAAAAQLIYPIPGGSTLYGAGGQPNGPANTGTGYGSGGTGTSCTTTINAAGAAGAKGLVIVTEYCSA